MHVRPQEHEWREKDEEDTLHGFDEASDSEARLLSDDNDSSWARHKSSTIAVTSSARKYYYSMHTPEILKQVGTIGARVSRKPAWFFAIMWLGTLIAWLAGQSPPEVATKPFRPNWLNPPKAPVVKISSEGSEVGTWKKPEGFQIVGVVFYGRRVHVDILDCYLKQNLATNGGYLDGVIFLQNTDDEEDIKWLADLVANEPRYKSLDFGSDVRHWKHMYDRHWDENTMYFKIDDDLVYIHPDAIPLMTHTLMDHPEAHNVQANIVNSASTSWQHFHSNAVRPYLPEIVEPESQNANSATWRPSELPRYPAHYAKDKYNLEDKVPFNGHRWLPLDDTSVALMKTPIRQCENYAWGNDWTKWGIAAQHHYSLFSNIEEGTMDRYIFGNNDGIFNTQYERYKINLMAIWGSTINMAKPQEDDEREFTEEIPLKLGMPVYVQTKAIAAHFSFEPQREIYQTDLMPRYLAYANERVCTAGNQKTQFPDWLQTLKKWGVKVGDAEDEGSKEKSKEGEEKEGEAKEDKEKEN